MPRAKRTLTQVLESDVGVECLPTTSENLLNDNEPRPKRIRKQTKRFSNTTTTTRPRKAKPKASNRSKDKGKDKEIVSEHKPLVNSTESEKPVVNAPSKRSKANEEKRLAQFRSQCPQKVLERAERVRTQRFFMIDRKREGKELKEEFKVLGSTANVYTVTIDHKPKCDCPDNRMGNHCKHIMFIFLKVLNVPIESHIWYQKALLTSELDSVFSAAPEAPNSVMNPRVREAFLRATGQIAESSTTASNNKRRIPGEEDDCPICYDTMFEVAETALVFCEECGNALHKECFAQYKKSTQQSGKTLTCVWCRSERGVAGDAKPSSSQTTQWRGFINLSGVIPEVDGRRDTSTYYHGPRQGQHYYGYNSYAD